MERGLSWLMAPYTAAGAGGDSGKLWQLLERQTQRYTMEESASVRVETAQELLESLLYCLRLGLRGKGEPAGAAPPRRLSGSGASRVGAGGPGNSGWAATVPVSLQPPSGSDETGPTGIQWGTS